MARTKACSTLTLYQGTLLNSYIISVGDSKIYEYVLIAPQHHDLRTETLGLEVALDFKHKRSLMEIVCRMSYHLSYY